MTSRPLFIARALCATLMLVSTIASATTAKFTVVPAAAPKLRATSVRAAATLPSVADAMRAAAPLSAASLSDSFLVMSHGFQDLGGACNDRGWTTEDRTTRLYAHVQSQHVVNAAALFGLQGSQFPTYPTSLNTAMYQPEWIARTDSGTFIVGNANFLSEPLVELYPNNNTQRLYGPLNLTPDLGNGIAFNPTTHEIDAVDGDVKIVRVPPGGPFIQIAGGGSFTGDTNVVNAELQPTALAVDRNGDIYFLEHNRYRVRMLRASDQRIVTVAGNGTNGFGGDGGPAISASVTRVDGIAIDTTGRALYVSDYDNLRVRRVDLNTGIITTVAGDGNATTLLTPGGLAFSGGSLYIIGSRSVNGAISNFIFKLTGSTLSAVVGSTDPFGSSATPDLGTQMMLGVPALSLAADGAGGCVFSYQQLVMDVGTTGHVSVVAGAPRGVQMGSRALWFGADTLSAPADVKNWVQPQGYGNGWSQRLISPTYNYAAHNNAVLDFDIKPGFLSSTFGAVPNDNSFFVVQGLGTGGQWLDLSSSTTGSDVPGAPLVYGGKLTGPGVYHVTIDFAGANHNAPLAATTQLRIIFQTNAAGSNEDGIEHAGVGGAILDNLTFRDPGNVDVFPPADFEDGTTGVWTLAALNGAYGTGTAPITRDIPFPNTSPQLQSGVDFADTTCGWTFWSPGDSLANGAYARISSPWVKVPEPLLHTLITFSGRLNTTTELRPLMTWVRFKNAGESRPHTMAPAFFGLNSGSAGADVNSPFTTQKVLTFPNDFQVFSPAGDSMQVVFEVQDRGEELDPTANPIQLIPRPKTRLPFIDDVRIYQPGVDQDLDGVDDLTDACPTVSAAGQDANGDGCLDATATMHHVESWAASALPLHFRISQDGMPSVTDGSDLAAIRAAFRTWEAVPGAQLSAIEDAVTSQTVASPNDGINLITFEDNTYQFSPSVLAVTPTLSYTTRSAYDDKIVLPGQIVDADMMFNPNASFSTPTHPGAWDLQSVATHEAGHFFGLSHSGVETATMFFVQQPGKIAATLKNDDMAAIAAAYPSATLQTSFATIKGVVTRDTTGAPVPGALVTAVHLDINGAPVDTAGSDYTREDGSYAIYHLSPGTYGIHIQALDGTVLEGLTADFISAHLLAIAQTNFDPEWYSVPEGYADDRDAKEPLTVVAGQTLTGINVITNLDTLPPVITSVTPGNGNSGVAIDGTIVIGFNEAVDASTIAAALRVHPQNITTRLAGSAILTNHGSTLLFTPDAPLNFASPYVIDITTALTDVHGIHLPSQFTSSFTSQSAPPVALSGVQPRTVPIGGVITITGQGFSPADSVLVSIGPSGQLPLTFLPTSVSTGTVVAQVPALVTLGADSVSITGFTANGPYVSNRLALQVVAPPPQTIPVPSGAPISLSFSPSDVALSNDGGMAYVVGSGGFVTINLDAARADYRVPVSHLTQPSQHIRVTPDGTRAVITQPGANDVLVVDASPSSGTLGVVQDTVYVPASPTDVVIDPTGQRAYITDPANLAVYAADVRTGVPTAGQILKTYPFTVGPGSQIAVHPNGKTLVVGGSFGMNSLNISDSTSTHISFFASSGRIVLDPSGVQIFTPYPGGAGFLSTGTTDGSALNILYPLAGPASDVAMSPLGQSLYMLVPAINQLQVFDNDATTGTSYHTVVGQVTTGNNPAAIAISGNGNLIAVGNAGDRSVSLFTTGSGGGAALASISPTAAMVGDEVALVNGSPLTSSFAGASVDLGAGTFAASHSVVQGAAFVVPPMTQRTTSATVQLPSGTRSLSLPFTVVNPLATFVPHPVGQSFPIPLSACGAPLDTGPIDHMKLSPDGRVLATHHCPTACQNAIDLFEIADDGLRGFGGRDSAMTIPPGGNSLIDFAFTPDGKRIWAPVAINFCRVVDADPSSPTYTNNLFNISGSYSAVAADPLGRFMIMNGPGASFFRMDGLLLKSVGGYFTGAHGIAIAPDGHRAVMGGDGLAYFVDVDQESLITSSPLHSVPGGPAANTVDQIAITSDGKRALGLFRDGTISVWITDPSLGAFGTETFHGQISATHSQLNSPVAGYDGHSILCGDLASPDIIRLDLSVTPPTVLLSPTAQLVTYIARSQDGRRIYGAHLDAPSNIATLETYSLAQVAQMALVSGDQQTAAAGATLPLPVQVRVTDGIGNPQVGAVVKFDLGTGLNGSIAGVALPAVQTQKLTDTNGQAQVFWTLPPAGTAVSMTVTALGTATSPIVVTGNVAQNDNLISPVVIQFGPADQSSGVNAGSEVYARFNQKIDATSAASHIALYSNGAPVAGAFHFTDSNRTVLFQPSSPLAFAARCSLVVATGLQDQEGQTLAATTHAVFTTQNPPALTLTSLTPPAGPANTPVTINGTGFSPTTAANNVLFNGALATVSANNLTSLVANAPLAATSGPVTVQVGPATSNPLSFTVLPPNADPGGVLGDLPGTQGIRGVAMTPDGKRIYVTNPSSNTLTALDVTNAQSIASITVGSRPQSVAILPDGSRAYVANTGSNNVSVVDVNPVSGTYNQVLKTIAVDAGPIDVEVSPLGPTVYVLNQASGTMSVIDATFGDATFDQVTTTVNTGTGGTHISISVDGTHAYVTNSQGFAVVDLASDQVTTTVKLGSGGTDIQVSADGTLAFVLTTAGQLVVVNLIPGPQQYQVTTTVNTGNGGTHIAISADGTLAYVTNGSGNLLLTFQITRGNGATSTFLPPEAVTLTPKGTFAVGQNPTDVVVDPTGKKLAYVVNSASGTITQVGFPNGLPPIVVQLKVDHDELNLNSAGRWIRCTFEPPAPYTAEQIDIPSIRFNGIVSVDPHAPHMIWDRDHDGIHELSVRFLRSDIELAVGTGDSVPVFATGLINGRAFIGRDTIDVDRGKVTHPSAGNTVLPGQICTVTWQTPHGIHVDRVAFLHTMDGGFNWIVDADHLKNTGSYNWHVPNAITDSAKVAVVFVDDSHDTSQPVDSTDTVDMSNHEDDVSGALAVSDLFNVFGATDVQGAPAVLTFAPIWPNPARTEAVMRFGLPTATAVKLEVFDLQGRRVRTLASGMQAAGWHEQRWTGRTDGGTTIGPGLYFVRFEAQKHEFKQRLVWLH
jgi:YVTN family beta-propeller protein